MYELGSTIQSAAVPQLPSLWRPLRGRSSLPQQEPVFPPWKHHWLPRGEVDVWKILSHLLGPSWLTRTCGTSQGDTLSTCMAFVPAVLSAGVISPVSSYLGTTSRKPSQEVPLVEPSHP